MSNQSFTRSKRKESESQNNNSAISNHGARANRAYYWLGGRKNSCERGSENGRVESIWIRRRARSVMNRDEGIYNLSHVYDPVIQEKS